MPQDCFMISATAAELDSRLKDGRVDKIYMPTRDKILISLRAAEGNIRLLLEAGNTGRVHITTEKYENPEVPPMFCMMLRKHLSGGRIVSVKQPYFERMMEITVLSADELGDLSEKTLIIEMMGRRNNIIFCDNSRRIMGCLKKVDLEMSPDRPVLPGLNYGYPPKQDKIGLMDLTEDKLKTLFDGMEATPKAFADKVAGVSPLLAREVFDLCEKQGVDFPQGAMGLQSAVQNLAYTPCMLLRDGEPFDFAAFSIGQYGDACQVEEYGDFSALLDAFYREKSAAEHRKAASSQLTKFLENAVARQERKLANQKNELLTAQNREELKRKADLIAANLHLIKKGDKKALLIDYYDETMPQVEVELDDQKSPQQNAQKLYDAFGRMKNAEQMLEKQIASGQQELEYLESLLNVAQNAQDSKDLTALREELTAGGYLKNKDKKKSKPPKLSPRRYVTSDGFTVLCGRNNIENDALTMKTAGKQDIWLHARNVPGSHVILVCDGREATDTAITEAAGVAAYFSKMANQPMASIDYTTVRYVKKIPGAKPGMVTYSNFKTAFVKPALITVEGAAR